MMPTRYLCNTCNKWYERGCVIVSCGVLHDPGQCCHYGEILIEDDMTTSNEIKIGAHAAPEEKTKIQYDLYGKDAETIVRDLTRLYKVESIEVELVWGGKTYTVPPYFPGVYPYKIGDVSRAPNYPTVIYNVGDTSDGLPKPATVSPGNTVHQDEKRTWEPHPATYGSAADLDFRDVNLGAI